MRWLELDVFWWLLLFAAHIAKFSLPLGYRFSVTIDTERYLFFIIFRLAYLPRRRAASFDIYD